MPATSRCDRPGAILCRLPLSISSMSQAVHRLLTAERADIAAEARCLQNACSQGGLAGRALGGRSASGTRPRQGRRRAPRGRRCLRFGLRATNFELVLFSPWTDVRSERSQLMGVQNLARTTFQRRALRVIGGRVQPLAGAGEGSQATFNRHLKRGGDGCQSVGSNATPAPGQSGTDGALD